MSVCPYERCDLGNYKSFYAAQVWFVSEPRPQTAQHCGSYTFNARIKILTEIYCFHQYLSIDPKKSLHRPQTAHKLQIIVNMTADISETIIGRELGFQI